MGSVGPSTPHVAFLGLGAMGFAMSTHLVRNGIQVTGFDIYQPTLDRWTAACTKIQESENPKASFSTTTSCPEAVQSGANIIILMVATHYHVNSALFESGAVKALPQNIPIIIMSTVPPTYPQEVRNRLTDEFNRRDIQVVDAPVSGGVARSLNGTLTIMASSDDPVALSNPLVSTCLRTLSNSGKTLFPIPGTLGAGTSAKALNQVQCGIHIVASSEIMALAALSGLNTTQFYNTINTPNQTTPSGCPYGWTWMFTNRAPRMLDASLPIASAISIINKDVNIIYDEEARLNTTLPLLNRAQGLLKQAMDSNIATWDDAHLTKFYLDPSLKSESHQSLVMEQAVEGYTPASKVDTPSVTKTLLTAHSLINLISAYETVSFAQSLDLMGPKQRAMWFELIAGAAGGSTVFSEVIPQAFQSLEKSGDWKVGFREYVKEKKWDLEAVEALLKEVNGKKEYEDFKPVLVQGAIELVKSL